MVTALSAQSSRDGIHLKRDASSDEHDPFVADGEGDLELKDRVAGGTGAYVSGGEGKGGEGDQTEFALSRS